MEKEKERRFGITLDGELRIPNSVEYIKENEFCGNNSIKKIIFPSTVKEIGRGAFKECSSLEKVEFLHNSKCCFIDEEAFLNCKNLKKIILPCGELIIKDRAFSKCEQIRQLFFPTRVKYIGRGAFSYCFSLEQVKINGVKTIVGHNAFVCCDKLKYLSIYSKEYKVFPGHIFSGVLLETEIDSNGIVYYKMQQFKEAKEEKIIGNYYYSCSNKEGFWGDGETKEKAYQDLCFNINRVFLKEKTKTWNKNTLITAQEYRIISGSCYFGVKSFCDLYRISENDKWPISKIAEKIKNFGHDVTIDNFLSFYEKLSD